MCDDPGVRDGRQALDQLRLVAGGPQLLAVLEQHPEARLVGGAVRDLLLGLVPREVDVVVAGNPRALAEALGPIEAEHERFGTLRVRAGTLPCDIAMARTEHYPHPGALPVVAPASIDEDLRRRDFTVNALTLSPAAGLGGVRGALEDLAARRLSVLHDRSFLDDPTRLWRLVRYAVRLGFVPAAATDALAHQAVRGGALDSISAQRRTAELRLALHEPDALAVLHAAQHLGLVSGLSIDPAVTETAQILAEGQGSAALTLLGSCITQPGWGEEFSFTSDERHILERCAAVTPLPAVPPARPAEIAAALDGEPLEAIAVAGARGDSATAHRWLHRWRAVTPSISGAELLAAGVPEGPELGRLLSATRAALLDGRIEPGHDIELAFALGEIEGPPHAG